MALKVSMVSLGVAFGLHAFIMNVAPYGGTFTTTHGSTGKACQAMLILAFISYAFAFLMAMTNALGEESGYVTSATKPIVVGSLAGLGVLFFLTGMIIFGVTRIDAAYIVSYHVASYSVAALFALYGCVFAIKGSDWSYTREP